MPKTSTRLSKSLEKSLATKIHATYDVRKSYEWNYREGPVFKGPYPPKRKVPAPSSFLGFPVASRLGIAAGPLLNSNWIRT